VAVPLLGSSLTQLWQEGVYDQVMPACMPVCARAQPLNPVLYHPSQDLVQEVFTHLEGLSKAVGGAAGDVLNKMTLTQLQEAMGGLGAEGTKALPRVGDGGWGERCTGVLAEEGAGRMVRWCPWDHADQAAASDRCGHMCRVPSSHASHLCPLHFAVAARYGIGCPGCQDKADHLSELVYRMALPLR
jgi:hypothetical protein